jgi:lysozyme
LKKGDLPPVLDIERLPENQSVDRLKIGLKKMVESGGAL